MEILMAMNLLEKPTLLKEKVLVGLSELGH